MATGLPIPGPVIGVALLFLGHALPAGGLLERLALMFVPAGVAVRRAAWRRRSWCRCCSGSFSN